MGKTKITSKQCRITFSSRKKGDFVDEKIEIFTHFRTTGKIYTQAIIPSLIL